MTETTPPLVVLAIGADRPSAGEQAPVRNGSRARVHNAALKVLRRAHLFAGLFMTPWVFLYGITGFLFNHPDAFPDREIHNAGRAELVGTALDGFPTAPELGESLVKALNARAGTSTYRLVEGEPLAFSRPLFVTASGRGREHSVRFDPESGDVFIRSTRLAESKPIPWPGGSSIPLGPEDSPRDRLSRGIPVLLAKLGIAADATTVKNPPELICTIEEGGRRWRIAYNLVTGATVARPADQPGGQLSTRLFLTRLHLAFTYPARIDARWFWALAVDAMFVSMVFWGISGLLMWWQMKKLRGWGAVTLLLSAAVASALAITMHAVLVAQA